MYIFCVAAHVGENKLHNTRLRMERSEWASTSPPFSYRHTVIAPSRAIHPSIHPSIHIRLLNDDETHLSLPFSRLRRSDIDLDLICLPSVTLGAYYGTSTLLYAAFAAHRRLHSLTPTVLWPIAPHVLNVGIILNDSQINITRILFCDGPTMVSILTLSLTYLHETIPGSRQIRMPSLVPIGRGVWPTARNRHRHCS